MSDVVHITVQDPDVAVVRGIQAYLIERVLNLRYAVTLKAKDEEELYGFEASFSAGVWEASDGVLTREHLAEELLAQHPARLIFLA